MKKSFLPLLAALALTVGTAAAQSAPATAPAPMQQGRPMPSPEQMAAHQTERLTKELSLTSDQSTKVQQIMQQRVQDMQAMRGQLQAGTSREQMHDQMKANRAKYDDQLKAVLNPDQYTKYTAMQAERRHHGPGMDGPADGKVKVKGDKLKIKES